MVMKFGTGIDLDNISDEFDGQGQDYEVRKKLIPGVSDLSDLIPFTDGVM